MVKLLGALPHLVKRTRELQPHQIDEKLCDIGLFEIIELTRIRTLEYIISMIHPRHVLVEIPSRAHRTDPRGFIPVIYCDKSGIPPLYIVFKYNISQCQT